MEGVQGRLSCLIGIFVIYIECHRKPAIALSVETVIDDLCNPRYSITCSVVLDRAMQNIQICMDVIMMGTH